jgi:hypothetical protein
LCGLIAKRWPVVGGGLLAMRANHGASRNGREGREGSGKPRSRAPSPLPFRFGCRLRVLPLVFAALAAANILRVSPVGAAAGPTTNLDPRDALLIKLGITNQPAMDEYAKTGDPRRVDPVLTNLFLAEYNAFRATLGETSLVHAAQTVLVLEARSEELLTNAAAGGPSRSNRLAACRAAWILCLRVERLSTNAVNAEAKRIILDAWNRSLRQGTASAAMQVAALATIWDPTLATEDLWRLFEAAHDKTTVSAFATLVANRGSAEDWERLRNKVSHEGFNESAGILRHTLEWKAWVDKGKKGAPPSWGAPLPIME